MTIPATTAAITTIVPITKAMTINVTTPSAQTAFATLAKKRASPSGDVIMSYFDYPFLDSALNFYETSLKRLNITNYVFAASDVRCCDALNALDGDSCIVYKSDTDSGSPSEFGSSAFIRKMNIRTDLILSSLAVGLHVLHSDIDIYYMKNPFDYLKTLDCDIATLVDDNNMNAGFVYVKPTPNGIGTYKKMRSLAEAQPRLNDQEQLNAAINDLRRTAGLKHIALPTDQFLCGRFYFEHGRRTFAADNPCDKCIVIHNNFIASMEAKEYRAKETGLWDYDGASSYFSCLKRKYVLFNNPYVFDNNNDKTRTEELRSLQAALAIASLLNRTLILPAFHCDGGATNFCSMISFYRMSRFYAQFGKMFREHSFLSHRKVPPTVVNSRSKLFLIASERALELVKRHQQQVPSDVTQLMPADKQRGANSSEIVAWFGTEQSSILQFHSLYDAFSRFDSDAEQKAFQDKLAAGLQGASYMQL